MNVSNLDVEQVELTGLPNEFFAVNRRNFIENLKNTVFSLEDQSFVIVAGGDEISRDDSDVVAYHFQQEANFYFLTGVREPKFYAALDVANRGSLTLFYDQSKNDRDRVFSTVPSLDEISKKYNAPVFLLSDMHSIIASWTFQKLYLLSGVNSDSNRNVISAKLDFQGAYEPLNSKVDSDPLIYEILADTRVTKSKQEVQLLKEVAEATVQGHHRVIQFVAVEKNERNIEATFMNHMRSAYHARIWAYDPICGTGINSSVLHYNKNNSKLKDGELILMDMGIRIGGYSSDVTSTVPVNGKFSDKQAEIYNIVLKANQAARNLVKPGVKWQDVHLAAEEVILAGLQNMKLLNSEFDVKEMLDNRVAYYFMPHGVGHLIGIDVHDVGGYLSFTAKRSDKPGLDKLRTARTLAANMVLTVEPGIYFIKYLLNKAFSDEKVKKYFNQPAIEKEYLTFGGVRIEDMVLVTQDGNENLTGSLVRSVEAIEALMKK